MQTIETRTTFTGFLRGSAAFIETFFNRLFRPSRKKEMDQLFLNSFNKSYPAWVKKGWVKKPED
jgi:hypothetical protein